MRNAFFDYARSGSANQQKIIDALGDWPDSYLSQILYDWEVWARDDQLPLIDPDCLQQTWRTWLILGGRGAGKTRAGAEWVRAVALGKQPFACQAAPRIALIGETMQDVRSVMVEGVSGLLAIHPDGERPEFEPSKSQLTWPNGSVAHLYSAETPDSLRGPQFAAAWCDEIAKWRYAEETWDMLQFALRVGSDLRAVVTTTPRPVPILSQLLSADTTIVSKSKTSSNTANLAPAFVEELERRYGGTQLGRQELDGELIEVLQGALWRADWIAASRVSEGPELQRIVVAVDPPVTSNINSDACGIVVAGLGTDSTCYVLADKTLAGRAPATWARAAVAAYYDFEADLIVAEVNQGGDLVENVIRQIDANVPISKVRASRGKWVRAEPVAALYAEGRVAHVGELRDLEQQMLAFGANGRAGRGSPDRVDAMVWAVTELMLSSRGPPSARMI
ncbi:MAG: terminase family protein [Pseudomonadota bacterium]